MNHNSSPEQTIRPLVEGLSILDGKIRRAIGAYNNLSKRLDDIKSNSPTCIATDPTALKSEKAYSKIVSDIIVLQNIVDELYYDISHDIERIEI